MIHRLRVKFICIFMVITMLLVGGILGVVIHFTSVSLEMQSVTMLHALARDPLPQRNPGNLTEEIRLPYFTVQIGSRGEMIAVSGGYYDLSDKDNLKSIVAAALASQSETGKLKEYDLRFLIEKTPAGYLLVFSDTSSETATLKNLIYGSILIYLAATVLFFGVSILLSKWSIRPVETAWQQQRQFVADASHEFKTPLSVIMANAELLSNEDIREEDRIRFSKNILSMSYQMRSLVESLLEMARIDSGTVEMPMELLDFSELVADAVMSFQPVYAESERSLVWEIEDGLCIHGNEHALFQLLDVLLDNGRKYSDPASRVVVRLQRSGRVCVLTVSSSGATLSREELQNIFKRFYRGDKARAMNGSYGLGLSIAHGVVEMHRGKIWAESVQGQNTFFVQLPLTHGSNRLEIPAEL